MAKKMKANTSESPMSITDTPNNISDAKPADSDASVAGQVSGMVDSAKQAGAHVLDQAKDQVASHADQQVRP